MEGFKSACLPSTTFHDVGRDGRLAGYGKYHRNRGDTCQTNQFGKFKYHYCKGGPNPCRKDKVPEDEECSKFYDKNKEGVKDVSSGKDEIMILHRVNNTRKYQTSSCFRRVNPESPEYGWCEVKGNYYDLDRPRHLEPSAWGYCSRDCFLDKKEADGSKLRVADEDVVVTRDSISSLNISGSGPERDAL